MPELQCPWCEEKLGSAATLCHHAYRFHYDHTLFARTIKENPHPDWALSTWHELAAWHCPWCSYWIGFNGMGRDAFIHSCEQHIKACPKYRLALIGGN